MPSKMIYIVSNQVSVAKSVGFLKARRGPSEYRNFTSEEILATLPNDEFLLGFDNKDDAEYFISCFLRSMDSNNVAGKVPAKSAFIFEVDVNPDKLAKIEKTSMQKIVTDARTLRETMEANISQLYNTMFQNKYRYVYDPAINGCKHGEENEEYDWGRLSHYRIPRNLVSAEHIHTATLDVAKNFMDIKWNNIKKISR